MVTCGSDKWQTPYYIYKEQNPAYRPTVFLSNTLRIMKKLWKFLTYDIWRITEDEVTKTTFSLYTIIKTSYLCITRFAQDRIVVKASALTYSTLLAIVPMLAILFAIARGFGFDHLVEQQVNEAMAGQKEAVSYILQFVNSYLAETKNGIFIGVGIIMLLWTVLNLINSMEVTFNGIWQVKKGRSMYRKVTDYFSMLLLMPILVVLSGGLSIFMTTMVKHIEGFALLAPIGKFLVRLIPFVLTWCMFTALYVFMPNTKVKLKHALIAGILAGSAYQLFQMLYISGQVSVARYNAIYGSFAALPLLLLWLQISWTIVLFGATLTYAGQNLRNYSFDRDTRNISRRYHDFVAIVIMSSVAKRFDKGADAYTVEELSAECDIPLRLTHQVVSELQDVGLLHEVATDEKSAALAYLPSIDLARLNVAMLLERLDTHGSEDFKIDRDVAYNHEWQSLLRSREAYYLEAREVLLKDL